VAHNLKNYDSHFIIKHFQKQYAKKVTKGQKIYDDVQIIPLNGERFLQFQIGNIKFLDSFQFLSASLEHLVTLLLKSGKQNFRHTVKFLGDTPFTFAKGVYMHSYMTDRGKYDETKLPSSNTFTILSTTNPSLFKTMNAPTKSGISTTSKTCDSITIIIYSPTCSSLLMFSKILDTPYFKTTDSIVYTTWPSLPGLVHGVKTPR